MGEEFLRRIMVLGSVPSLGPVVLFDDMEDLLKWVETGTGGDSVFEKSATVAYNKAASLHMKSRTTDAAEDDTVTANRYCYARPGNRYRFEVIYTTENVAACKSLDFRIQYYDGTNLHDVLVRYNSSLAKWQYMNTGGTFSDFSGGTQQLDQDAWHRVLFEVDLDSGEITRLVSDGLELSGLELGIYESASATAQHVVVSMTGTTAGGAACEHYFDDLLVMEI